MHLKIICFILKESGIIVESSMREQFMTLNHIKESLKNKNITPALEWVKENRAKLNLQVIYPKLYFIKIIRIHILY